MPSLLHRWDWQKPHNKTVWTRARDEETWYKQSHCWTLSTYDTHPIRRGTVRWLSSTGKGSCAFFRLVRIRRLIHRICTCIQLMDGSTGTSLSPPSATPRNWTCHSSSLKKSFRFRNSQLSPCTSSFYKFELHLTRLFFDPKSQINLITFCIESWQGIAQYMIQDAFHII